MWWQWLDGLQHVADELKSGAATPMLLRLRHEESGASWDVPLKPRVKDGMQLEVRHASRPQMKPQLLRNWSPSQPSPCFAAHARSPQRWPSCWVPWAHVRDTTWCLSWWHLSVPAPHWRPKFGLSKGELRGSSALGLDCWLLLGCCVSAAAHHACNPKFQIRFKLLRHPPALARFMPPLQAVWPPTGPAQRAGGPAGQGSAAAHAATAERGVPAAV